MKQLEAIVNFALTTTNVTIFDVRRFFDDIEASIGSLCIQNKREFTTKLAEIDHEYAMIISGLMDELKQKTESIRHEI